MTRHPRASVDERWQASGDGAHYATSRWRSTRARSRDPRLVDRLLRSLPEGTGPIASVLDVPCGTGRLREGVLASIERRSPGAAPAAWCGVDVSGSMLREVPGTGARLLRGTATALPFGDASFDLVLCCRLLHHYDSAHDRRDVLRELFRVSRRHVVFSFWDAASLTAWRRRTRGPFRRRKGAGVRHAAEWSELRADVAASGGEAVRRVHSMRFVSAQSFVLADVRR